MEGALKPVYLNVLMNGHLMNGLNSYSSSSNAARAVTGCTLLRAALHKIKHRPAVCCRCHVLSPRSVLDCTRDDFKIKMAPLEEMSAEEGAAA